jgi:hypothetical protein
MFDKRFYAHGKTVQRKQPASGARRKKMNLLYSIKDSITQCGIKVYLGLWTICPMQKG